MKIAIVNYGSGNVGSIFRMIEHVGGKTCVINSPEEVKNAEKIILPGVGSFDHGMRALANGGWTSVLSEAVLKRKVPALGICLGMQLMCSSSEEGELPGLGWIDAKVRKFSFPKKSRLKVPHMGWNLLRVKKANNLVNSDEEERFYFVHSYYVECTKAEDVVATTFHGHEFVSYFCRDNIYGAQFHPEKSHRFGMEMLKRFVELPC